MKRMLLLLAGAAVVTSACDAPTLPGHGLSEVYDFRLLTTPRSVLRWPSGTVVRVYVAGGEGARAALLTDAFEHGARVWNQHAHYGEYRLVRTTDLTAADAVLRWSDDVSPVDMSECEPSIVRAVTTFCLDPQRAGRLAAFPLLSPHDGAASSVRMVVTILGTQTQQERLNALVAHELGHVLGIGQHSLDSRDLMYGGEPGRADPSPRDIASTRVMYHTRPDIIP